MSILEENTTSGNKMNPMVIVGVVVALLIVAAVVVFGMKGNNTASNSGAETMLAEDAHNMDGDMIGGDAMGGGDGTTMEIDQSAIEIEGGAFYFEPNEIRVRAGEPVTVTLNSVSEDDGMDMKHDFVIDELNVQSEEAAEGESTTFTFTPTEPGEYEFYCSVGEHRANGMFGTLIVE